MVRSGYHVWQQTVNNPRARRACFRTGVGRRRRQWSGRVAAVHPERRSGSLPCGMVRFGSRTTNHTHKPCFEGATKPPPNRVDSGYQPRQLTATHRGMARPTRQVRSQLASNTMPGAAGVALPPKDALRPTGHGFGTSPRGRRDHAPGYGGGHARPGHHRPL